jgi:ATP-binding cassette subfamily B protein RaxB
MQQSVYAIRAWALLYFGIDLEFAMRANVFFHLIRLPVQYFERRHLRDVVPRFGSIGKSHLDIGKEQEVN